MFGKKSEKATDAAEISRLAGEIKKLINEHWRNQVEKMMTEIAAQKQYPGWPQIVKKPQKYLIQKTS